MSRAVELGRPGVLVVGMHRSGTSAAAHAISRLGFDLGQARLAEAGPHNPRGHWEPVVVNDLNDEILERLGGDWAAPPPAGVPELVSLASGEFGDRAHRLQAESFPETGWIWKDPRASVLLPFWLAVLPSDTRVVIVSRHPAEIAASLAARDGFAPEYSFALWERHLRSVLEAVRGRPAAVVPYARLIGDATGVLDELATWLLGRSIEVADAATSVEPSFRDHVVEGPGELPPAVARLWGVLDDAAGVHDTFPHADLGPETLHIQMAFDEHHRMKQHADAEMQLREHAEQLARRVGDLEAELAEARSATVDLLAEHQAVLEVSDERERRLLDLQRRLLVRVDGYVRRRLLRR